MRANTSFYLTAVVVLSGALAMAAPALGQIRNPVGGDGTKPYPTAEVRDQGPNSTRANPVLDYRKGVIALKAGEYRQAIASFDRALIIAPKDSNTWTMLGISKEGAGDLKGAFEAYEKAVQYKDDNIAARQRLGVTAAKLGRTDQAQAALADLQKRSSACGPRCPSVDKLKSAVAVVTQAIAQGPDAAPAKG
jgi:tetratricopeptide (TPR) repeat protein